MNQSSRGTHAGSRRSTEALWWALFSAGGVMAAIFIPALIIITVFILPVVSAEDEPSRYELVHGLVSSWLVRLPLLVVIVLSLFHCAHRIRHILLDAGLHEARLVLRLTCYGGAIVGSIAAAIVVFTF